MRLQLVVVLCAALARAAGGARYAFYRGAGAGGARRGGAGGARRVFGGAGAPLSAFPAACALLDRYWAPRCSASVLTPRWALTAAHCVSPHVAYVMYNARRPAEHEGDVAAVTYLYRHPGFRVVQEDEGRGMDVTHLYHDVGLLRTRTIMTVANDPPAFKTLTQYNLEDLEAEEVQVLGYGRTESGSLGEQLFAVRLQLVQCARDTWRHCMCGEAARGGGGGGGRAGVCAGDSGGPVLYRGAQVGVTSMGPLECAESAREPDEGSTSVFTSLYQYAALVNATMHGTDAALQMRRLSPGAAPPRAPPPALLASLLAPLLAPLLAARLARAR